MSAISKGHYSVFLLATLPLMSLTSSPVYGQYSFNPSLLETTQPSQSRADLSVFERGGQPPGEYQVEILLNQHIIDRRSIRFYLATDPQGQQFLQPCLSSELLTAYGINPLLLKVMADQPQCTDLAVISQASASFQFNQGRLMLSFPQAALFTQARGYIAPQYWDEGINAVLLNYSLSAAHSQSQQQSRYDNSYYFNLRPGVNIGPWRVRSYMTHLRSQQGNSGWDVPYIYAKRNLIAWKSQLTLGESSSSSDVFDGVPFLGVELASDDDMLPDSLKGYAPVVRGIARSHAQIIIRQNGYIIYQNYVAPGAFSLTDMYPTGGSGDLFVTVKEADGSEQNFIVPYASLPVLQREGRFKYSLVSGQYRAYDSRIATTPYSQFNAIYGVPYGITLYGGIQQSSKYQALAVGIGQNLGEVGALSLDNTQSWAKIKRQDQDYNKQHGQAWRVRFNKNFTGSGTNLAVAGYRYTTQGYYGLQEAMEASQYAAFSQVNPQRRSRTELLINQRIGANLGALALGLVNEDYWYSQRQSQSISLGYNHSWQGISYGVDYSFNQNVAPDSYTHSSGNQRNHLFAFNISLPLSRWLSDSYVNYNVSSNNQGHTSHNIGLNGTLLADQRLSWYLQQGYINQGEGSSSALGAAYRGTYGELGAGYTDDYRLTRLNYSLQGAVVAHQHGITFGQSVGETSALVKASGADGVKVINQSGISTDFRGYALVPYVSAYRQNDIRLDSETLPNQVELTLSSQRVIPTRGALVRANFDTRVGQRLLLTMTQLNGQWVPFGAIASLSDSAEAQGFIVGDKGQVYLTGLPGAGQLKVQWGKSAAQQCEVNYQLTAVQSHIQHIEAVCA